jgi:7-keto-8-aminopelargonate synthetase-like enzyme
MRGQQGKLKESCDEAKIQLPFTVDDAHGFGTLGKQELEQVRNKEFKMILMFIFQLLQNQWLTLVLYCS